MINNRIDLDAKKIGQKFSQMKFMQTYMYVCTRSVYKIRNPKWM